ncbi:hypothetical protein KY290_017042 [Solanum tuberosum]|uniref:D-isomer specific 2-hydroxyacid dehydrogenase NAD-binding domain-containing protein n=1 Tax=Solanum tuberosum TaxID=4113 RepID=A0ABQ7VA61_SOLTU|nr:hypothetical protein KY284_016110 [Solanum tuberosum]KAH0760969.1 hypothetical protein KY290_017042 [Solanum tuberosum]
MIFLGNSSQVSNGAAAVLLMKRSIAMQKGLPILGVFRYNSPEDNVKQLYTLCKTKKYYKMLILEILTSSTAHSLSSTIFLSVVMCVAKLKVVVFAYHLRLRTVRKQEFDSMTGSQVFSSGFTDVLSNLCCQNNMIANEVFLRFLEMEMFDKERIAKLKKGVLIINNARGAIMDTQAVVDACNNGHIAGYSGDVWYPQPAPKDHLWHYMPNQAMTPHILGLPLMHSIWRPYT